MSYKLDCYLPLFGSAFSVCFICWDPFPPEQKYPHILTLNFEGVSRCCCCCLAGLFYTRPLYSSRTICPITHHCAGPSSGKAFESVTSYCSWTWSGSNKFITKTSNKPTWEINAKVTHELWTWTIYSLLCIPFVISDMKIKPCCLFLHRLGGWLKGEFKKMHRSVGFSRTSPEFGWYFATLRPRLPCCCNCAVTILPAENGTERSSQPRSDPSSWERWPDASWDLSSSLASSSTSGWV